MSQKLKRSAWFQPWKRIFIINVIFFGTIVILGLLYFLLVKFCYRYIGLVCHEFIGPPIGF